MKSTYIISLFSILFLFSSCYTTHFTVGDGPIKDQGKQETYDKAKQMWLLWGLFVINDGNPNTPSDNNYMIKTKFTFGDILITSLTGGVFTIKSVKVKVKKVKASNSYLIMKRYSVC